jgi:amino acid adenylation domain-containing protein
MNAKTGATDRLSGLSPQQRRLLLQKLQEQAAAQRGGEVLPTPTIRPVPRDQALPLSFPQQRLWFLDQFEPGSNFYNMPAVFRLTGRLDRETLAWALSEIVRRHESLRTTFATVDGQPLQVIAPPQPVEPAVVDLTTVPAAERESRGLEAAREEAERGFDLACGPLFRVTLIALAPEDAILILNMHHIVSDGWSIGVLAQELSTLYAAFSAGRPSPLPELPIQYADFAHWQRNHLAGDVLAEQLAWWREHLKDAPPVIELPGDRPRPAVQRFRGQTRQLRFPAALSRALRETSQREDATLFMTLLAGFKTLLLRYTGQEDVVVGAGIANRNRVETEGLIGFFVNTLAMRTVLAGNPTFRELLHRVRETAMGAYAHQDLPFEKLVEELRPKRDLSRNPLVQIAFVLQNAPMPPFQLPGLTMAPMELEVAAAKFDWLLSISDTHPEITGVLEYNSDLFDEATIDRMLGHYQDLLAAFAADPGRRLRSVPLFGAEAAAVLEMTPERVETIAPLTPTQRDLYLDHELDPEAVTYSLGVSARLGAEIDPARWEAAVRAVAAAEPVARTRFTTLRGELLQVAERGAAVRFELLDLAQEGTDLETLIRRKVKIRYDLAEGHLFNSFLVRDLDGSYVAVVGVHHILCDAFSGRIFLEKVVAAYETGRAGAAGPTFFDHVGESLARFDTPETQRFWEERLAGVSALELHSGLDRPSSQRSASTVLAGDELRAIERYCKENDLSVAAYLRGLFGALLERLFSPAGDLLLYDVVGGRPREHAATIGCFYQVVPVVLPRQLFAPGATVSGFLREVREYRRRLGDHQNLSVLLQRRLLREEKLRFFYNFYNFAAFEALGRPAVLKVHDSFPENEVHLIVSDNGGEVEVAVHWNERFFSDLGVVERLLEMSRQVIAGEDRLGELAVSPAAERRQVLAGWNGTDRAYDAPHNLHLLLERQAEATPEAVAVSFEGEHLTYRELHRRANQLAHFLIGLGVGPETIVGSCVERSLDMVVGLLGILKAGGAYVPLDPGYPKDRLAFMAGDSGAPVLLTQARHREAFAGYPGRVVCLDEAWEEIARGPEHAPACRTEGDGLAYVIYTSGSTGRPKGAMNTHRAIANRLLWMQEAYGLTPDDRVLQKTPLSFDVSVWEVFWPLITGARLVVARPEGHKDGVYLVDVTRREGVTTLHFVPSMLRIFLAERGVEECRSIRRVVCSGEALPHDLQEKFFARLSCELHNLYGPTEAAVDVTYWACDRESQRTIVPIGYPIANTQIYLLDRDLRPVPPGIAGELHIGGMGLARGYLSRPGLTAEKFIPDPFGPAGSRLYKTGDLARHLPDGAIEYLGRIDHQVKLRGFRIELGEIEAALARHEAVREALSLVREDVPGEKSLVAYLVGTNGHRPARGDLARFLRDKLPDYMVPAHFVWLDAMPLLPNGKADRKALPAPEISRAQVDTDYAVPRNEAERILAGIWQDVLHLDAVGVDDNFFDLGGHSLLLVQVQSRVRDRFGRQLSMVELFRHSTVRSLAAFLTGPEQPAEAAPAPAAEAPAREARSTAVAVVGLAGRFPRSRDLESFWLNLREGRELISFFSDGELREAGVDPALLSHPGYVRAKALLDGVEMFDASFFGFNPREAELMDPQQRLFLEAAWEALENAGYDPRRTPGRVGVFAGQSLNTYLMENLWGNPEVMATAGLFQTVLGNDKDFLATRVSYKLGLKGPAMTVQTACSTSLVAVHLAIKAILDGECEMALAGGVSVTVPTKSGYVHQPGAVVSPDGHCRAFDASAQGTVPGNGLGLVVLKRLDDALADGDTIHAVIRGSAVNNDGSDKVGFTAPSVDGQAAVIREALARAGVSPESIGYVEAHGTGTPLGDPIEVTALRQVFGTEGSVALGSVKTNLGHLDAAAGVTGLIKAVLALEHGEVPPSLHFHEANPALELAGSPFHVPTQTLEWKRGDAPRRAGVSSFGIGGTNAHVVLEEAPPVEAAAEARPLQLLALSARTPAALENATANLADHLARNPDAPLADVAFTLQVGRHAFPHRRVLVARDAADALTALAAKDPRRVLTRSGDASERPVVFLFPGQGAQFTGMAADLYEGEPTFRETVDRCAEILRPHLDGLDLRQVLYPAPEGAAEAEALLGRTAITQPALFVVEYALAKLWMEWGVQPAAMIGHSVGEYVAATLAGVMPLEEALPLVALRGRMINALPAGAMLSVPLPESEILPLLGADLSLAAVNAPALCSVAGPEAAIARLEAELAGRGVACRRLHTSHAFHSAMMDPVVEPFAAAVAKVKLAAPRIPFVSSTTGAWITAEEATDPGYWARHLREAVRFAEGVATLAQDPARVLLEVGPGNTLSTLAKRQLGEGASVVRSLRHPKDAATDLGLTFEALGKLWLFGVPVDWKGVHRHHRRRRVPLPTYPFERQRYWIEPRRAALQATAAETVATSTETAPAGPAFELHERPSLATGYVAPETDIEVAVAGVWQELLGIGRVGVHDDFFELGGHSLLGTQVIARLQERFAVELAVDSLFATPTVAGLAETIEGRILDALELLDDDMAAQAFLGASPEALEETWAGGAR